ncbi:MAG: hypothetical protein ACE5E3_04085 [Mariprofundus sp.]
MSAVLQWKNLTLGHEIMPASQISGSEHVRLVMDFSHQYSCLDHIFASDKFSQTAPWKMWLNSDGERHQLGSPGFIRRIGSLIRQHGLIANLSMKENLLLPFLYRNEKQALQQAEQELGHVAERLGISSCLYEQAGHRTALTHALISLGRCLLSKPDFIVAQEVHICMPPDHLERFKTISLAALADLDCGLLYLTGSPNDGSDLNFTKTLYMQQPSSAHGGAQA